MYSIGFAMGNSVFRSAECTSDIGSSLVVLLLGVAVLVFALGSVPTVLERTGGHPTPSFVSFVVTDSRQQSIRLWNGQ